MGGGWEVKSVGRWGAQELAPAVCEPLLLVQLTCAVTGHAFCRARPPWLSLPRLPMAGYPSVRGMESSPPLLNVHMPRPSPWCPAPTPCKGMAEEDRQMGRYTGGADQPRLRGGMRHQCGQAQAVTACSAGSGAAACRGSPRALGLPLPLRCERNRRKGRSGRSKRSWLVLTLQGPPWRLPRPSTSSACSHPGPPPASTSSVFAERYNPAKSGARVHCNVQCPPCVPCSAASAHPLLPSKTAAARRLHKTVPNPARRPPCLSLL